MNHSKVKSWSPIRDYDDTPDTLAIDELRVIERKWHEQQNQIRSKADFAQFEIELKREWAIETGLIERLYTFNDEVTQFLIRNGIIAKYIPNSEQQDSKFVELIIKDQESALNDLFELVARERELSTSYIKELHSLITRHQETCEALDQFGRPVEVRLLRGEYKSLPNNPTLPNGVVYQYCPPEHVASEMDRMCALHRRHIEAEVAPEVEAAWLHHRFSSIHPFQDGNGRVARAIASLVFIQQDWFPLVVRNKDRTRYIKALENADSGQLKPLVVFFSELQIENFRNAISSPRSTASTFNEKL